MKLPFPETGKAAGGTAFAEAGGKIGNLLLYVVKFLLPIVNQNGDSKWAVQGGGSGGDLEHQGNYPDLWAI